MLLKRPKRGLEILKVHGGCPTLKKINKTKILLNVYSCTVLITLSNDCNHFRDCKNRRIRIFLTIRGHNLVEFGQAKKF